ncbi:PilW family protein [Patescibacteria group bacterium]
MRIKPIVDNKKGVTLVELLVMIGLFVIVGGLAIGFFVSVLSAQAKTRVMIETQEQARLVMERVVYETRKAKTINSDSSFGIDLAHDSSLSLVLNTLDPELDPTKIRIDQGVIYLKQGQQDEQAISSNEVQVNQFMVEDLSSENERSQNIKIFLSVFHKDPSGIANKDINYSLETAVELRGR